MELPNAIEAILFYQAEPMTVRRIAGLLKKGEVEVRDALTILEERLSASGLRLLRNGDEVALGTSPDASSLIEAITKEELSRELSKASLETLAIVLYKGPLTRAEIDYIRGVNSTFILRNLLIRGLIEKIDNPDDQRSFLYKPTFQLLEYMGVTKTEELPEYEATMAQLSSFMATKEEEPAEETETKEAATESPSDAEVNSPFPEIDETSDALLADEKDDSELEADVSEEDEAGENYDDDALQEHREEDAGR